MSNIVCNLRRIQVIHVGSYALSKSKKTPSMRLFFGENLSNIMVETKKRVFCQAMLSETELEIGKA